jgi:hypothetical protein
VLLLALVFVLMLTLVAASVVQTAALELRMAGNDQFREEAGQVAKAIVAELSLNPGNFSLASPVGHSNCAAAGAAPGCDSRTLQVPGAAQVASGYALDFRVTRTAPSRWEDYPVPGLPGGAAQAEPLDVALFEVEVRVDGRRDRRGAAHVVQGVAVQIPASPVAEPGEEWRPAAVSEAKLYRVYWREPGLDPL